MGWTDLLYINNFVPQNYEHICLRTTWYLALDMQFYLFTPLLVFLYYKSKKAGWIAAGVLFLASFATSIFIIAYQGYYTYVPDQKLPGLHGGLYENQIYSKPWARLGPYLVGVVFAWIVTELKANGVKEIPAWIRAVGTTVCAFLLISLVWGPFQMYHNKAGPGAWSQATNVAYLALGETAWAVALCWMVFAFMWGYGTHLKDLMEHRIWVPLARLTYGAYLNHPSLLFMVLGVTNRLPIWATDTILQYVLFICTGAYLMSYCSWILVEKPFMNLEKFFLL